MGLLAHHLAGRFQKLGARGWSVEPEFKLFREDTATAVRFGFNPKVDVMLSGPSGERVAIELEISRADPVANQAKFSVAQALGEVSPDTVLVSMFSAHVDRGRRNLCAAFARQLRAAGGAVFSASLLPFLGGTEVARLNQGGTPAELDALPAADELRRVLSVVTAQGEFGGHRIHYAGDVTDVVANVWAWNDGMRGDDAERWGLRHVQYFVYEPRQSLFAPAKFCAFIPVARSRAEPPPATMTLGLYGELDEKETRFDGRLAWRHLARRLAFEVVRLEAADAATRDAFARWHGTHAKRLGLRTPVQLLLPPPWFR